MLKYFIDRKGVKTKRLAGLPGAGHFDIAQEVLADLGRPAAPGSDLYQQMFTHGYARVAEEGNTVHVECPRPLTKGQKDFCLEKQMDGHSVLVNNREFVESKDARNGKPVTG